MDAGQDNFAKSVAGHRADPVQHVAGQDAAAGSPGIGDDAVAAERVAAVLDLEKGAGVVGEAGQAQCGGCRVIHDVADLARVRLEQAADGPLFAVAEDDVKLRNALQVARCNLGVAAGGDYPGIGVLAAGPPDQLAGFRIGAGGDGAGIDDVDIGRLIERD